MTYTLEALAHEQQGLRLARFDYDVAWRLGLAMRARAAAASLPVAITIAHGPDLVFATVLPGATSDNLNGPPASARSHGGSSAAPSRCGSRPSGRDTTSV
jgi:hypothetical protein